MEVENKMQSQSLIAPKNEPLGNGGKNSPTGGAGAVGREEELPTSVGKAILNVEEKKRGRGRPKKYKALSGNESLPYLSMPESLSSLSTGSVRQRPKRPKGTWKLQVLASLGEYVMDTAGRNFTPHVMDVYTGEDIVRKIASISLSSVKAVCVLSATGPVSRAMVHQPGPSGGIFSYEGLFEIISLNGSFVHPEVGNPKDLKSSMLSVSLAKPDGQVFGGAIAGALIAAGTIQLMVATFKQNSGRELKRKNFPDPSSAGSNSGGSQLVSIPLQSRGMDYEDDLCATPRSDHSAPLQRVVDNLVVGTDSFNSDSLGPHAMHGSHVQLPLSDQMMPPSTNGSVPDM